MVFFPMLLWDTDEEPATPETFLKNPTRKTSQGLKKNMFDQVSEVKIGMSVGQVESINYSTNFIK